MPGPSRSPGLTVGSEADTGPALMGLNAGGSGGCPAVVGGSPATDTRCTQEGSKRKRTEDEWRAGGYIQTVAGAGV